MNARDLLTHSECWKNASHCGSCIYLLLSLFMTVLPVCFKLPIPHIFSPFSQILLTCLLLLGDCNGSFHYHLGSTLWTEACVTPVLQPQNMNRWATCCMASMVTKGLHDSVLDNRLFKRSQGHIHFIAATSHRSLIEFIFTKIPEDFSEVPAAPGSCIVQYLPHSSGWANWNMLLMSVL